MEVCRLQFDKLTVKVSDKTLRVSSDVSKSGDQSWELEDGSMKTHDSEYKTGDFSSARITKIYYL